MHVEGTFQVRRDRAGVFAFFTDARRLVDCLDDPHTVEIQDETHFSGTVTTGVAFIRGTFRITGEYTTREPLNRVVAKLHGSGLGSGLDATISTTLEEANGVTTVRWTADMTFSGPVASMGERVVRGTVDKKTQSLFERARQRLENPSG
ncbi:MAG: carbon monoxide dehydrogenase subunit G [Thermoplasmata archaeon]|jgi:carbon monoxide dehydrogenase subunit G